MTDDNAESKKILYNLLILEFKKLMETNNCTSKDLKNSLTLFNNRELKKKNYMKYYEKK